jgi:hypothetical protein
MKQHTLIILLFSVLTFLSGCSKEDDYDSVFEKTADERIAEMTQKYADALESSEYGWNAVYYPDSSAYGGFSYLIRFNGDDKTCEIYSDLSSNSGEGTYRYQYQQEPSLIFDTYSLLHVLADPEYEIAGKGYGGDFEFYFRSISDDEILLEGKIHGGKLLLEKAGESDVDVIAGKYENSQLLSPQANTPFFRNLVIEKPVNRKIGFQYSSALRNVTISYLEGETQINESITVEFTKEGFKLHEPLTVGDLTIQNFLFDENSGLFVVADDNITGSLVFDNAPAATIPGVADNFLSVNFKTIVSYSEGLASQIALLPQTVPLFNSFQIYTGYGYVLAYAPGTDGGNWAGFSEFSFEKTAEDQISVGWGGYVYGDWWQNVYYNPGTQALLSFLLDPDGLYVVQEGEESFYLVSISDPSQYILVEF